MHRGNQETYRTRWAALRLPASCGKSSGPAQRTSNQMYPRSMTASRIRQSSSASTPLRCKLPGDETTRSLPTTSRWYSSPTSDPGSCTCRTTPYPPGQTYAISLLAPSRAATNPMAKRATFTCSSRRKESLCASSFRDSAVYTTTSQTSTPPRSSARSIRTCVTAGCGRRWRCARSRTSASCMPWPTSVRVLRRGGNSPEKILERENLTVRIPPRQGKAGGGTTRRRRTKKCWLLSSPAVKAPPRKPRLVGPARELPDAPNARQWRSPTVRTPILSHIDPACNTSYHFAASRTVLPRVPPYLAQDRLRLFAHVYDSVASIHMTENPGRHG